MLHAMIVAGGGGTRFWPRSRQARPKQFLALTGDRTLLQLAADRIEAQIAPEATWVMTGAQHRAEAARELPHVPESQVIGEPTGRDTAPCIALAAALIARWWLPAVSRARECQWLPWAWARRTPARARATSRCATS